MSNQKIDDKRLGVLPPGEGAPLEALMAFAWHHPDYFTDVRGAVARDPDHVPEQDMRRIAALVQACASRSLPDEWRGLYVHHIANDERMNVLASLVKGYDYLTQEILNFVTVADVPGVSQVIGYQVPPHVADAGLTKYGEIIGSPFYEWLYKPAREDVELCLAFAERMRQEVRGRRPIVGCYELAAGALPAVELLVYDAVRVVFVPGGVFLSFVSFNVKPVTATCIFWHAGLAFENQPCAGMGWRLGMVLHALGACLWRDACQVKEKVIAVTGQRKHKSRPGTARSHQRGLVRLPRVVYRGAWGSAGERERVLTRAHSVRGHYRLLEDDQQASQAAVARARAYGFPVPPDGYTFVKPHQRGQGDVGDGLDNVPQVVCEGLSTFALVSDLLAR